MEFELENEILTPPKIKSKTKRKTNINEQDSALKQLFSYPKTISDLLTGFVPEDWVKDIDFSSLHRLNVRLMARNGRTREGDMVWRVNFRGGDLYLLCLTEFQSEIEHFMALRIMTYTGLIFEDLLTSSPA